MKVKKYLSKVIVLILLIQINAETVLAATTDSTNASTEKLVTGTQNLSNWIMNVIMLVSGAVTAVLIAKEGLKIQAADEETDTKPYKNRIRTIVIWGVGIILIEAIVAKVLSFYK